MAQNIIDNPWERTSLWLSWMTTLLLVCLLWLFSFVSAFLISLIKLTLWLKFSTTRKAGRGHGRGERSCSFSLSTCPLYVYPTPSILKSFSRFKYGQSSDMEGPTRSWWFGIQQVWELASEEKNCVNVKQRDFLPKDSKMILFKYEMENSFYEATITLTPKPDKDATQKKKITGQYHWWT